MQVEGWPKHNVSTLKPPLFYAKSGRKKDLIFEKWDFQGWQKILHTFTVSLLM